jgi:hypothetical protein
MKTIIILSHNGGNGLSRYVCDIIDINKNIQIITNEERIYNKTHNIQIISNNKILELLENLEDNKDTIIHVNILPNYRTVDTNKYIDIIANYKLTKIITTIHDTYWFNQQEPNKLPKIIDTKLCDKLFFNSSLVIFPSKSIYNLYNKYVNLENVNFVIESHPDINYNQITPYFSKIEEKIKVIFIGDFDIHKGSEKYTELIEKYKDVEFHIVGGCHNKLENKNVIMYGRYSNNNIINIINKIKPNLFVNLSIFDETWSYVLSLSLKSGLPILHTDISLYNERLNNRINTFKINNISFDEILILLTKNQQKEFINLSEHKIIPTEFYKKLYNYNFYEKIHKKIKPYAIYFPQLHEVEENNIYYYKNFTDMTNLEKLKTENILELDMRQILTPLWGYYSQDNYDIINTQIKTAQKYGIYGFAIYHYWFSDNELFENKSKVMYKVIEKIFSQEYNDFEFYFIWANEDWHTWNGLISNNQNKKSLYNNYEKYRYEYTEYFEYLLQFFKHKNYTKIDNKPVFMIHHPHKIPNDIIDCFYNNLDTYLKKHNFNGLYMYINNLQNKESKYKSYHMHCNYMNNIKPFYKNNLCNIYDYETYINEKLDETKNGILTVFTGFNNSARLYKNENKVSKTIFINNNLDNFKKFLEIQFKKHNENIFMINAWNEWGENMVLEPSIEYNYNYLEIFRNTLCKFYN